MAQAFGAEKIAHAAMSRVRLAILACMAGLRVGFFGGSFDPPHWGHLAVARAAAEAFALDRVLLAPTARQPLKPEGATASFADRLAMVELLCGEAVGLEASAVDAPRDEGEPNFTVDTLARLRLELRGDDTIFVIVGVDAFLELRRWRAPEELLRVAEWIVVTRPGFSLDQLAELGLSAAERERVHLLAGVSEDVSATAVREALREGPDGAGKVVAMVPGPVLAYIRSRHLYET
jgi:nicotinate-nucleotide adenylyltransferase